MPRIQDTKGRQDENSGYVLLLGNTCLGLLISRVHATVIRTGNELERLLESVTPSNLMTELADAISRAENRSATGVNVVFSPKIKNPSSGHGITGDIVVFDYTNNKLSVIEVKDGDTFDTKESLGRTRQPPGLCRPALPEDPDTKPQSTSARSIRKTRSP